MLHLLSARMPNETSWDWAVPSSVRAGYRLIQLKTAWQDWVALMSKPIALFEEKNISSVRLKLISSLFRLA